MLGGIAGILCVPLTLSGHSIDWRAVAVMPHHLKQAQSNQGVQIGVNEPRFRYFEPLAVVSVKDELTCPDVVVK